MRTVTFEVASVEEVQRRAVAALRGNRQPSRISFATPELLWKVLTAKRWQLLKALAGQEPLSMRELARRVGRDVKAVHGDVHVLLETGVLDRTEQGRIEFSFDAIRVDFTLRAA